MHFSDNDYYLKEYYLSRDILLRNEIVEANLGLVRIAAHKMAGCYPIPIDDLIQIGTVGLIKAVEAYNPAARRRLGSFAVPYIEGAIKQWNRDKSRLVKVPRTLQETHQKLKRYSKDHGVSYEEAAKGLQIPASIAEEAVRACFQINVELPDSLSSSFRKVDDEEEDFLLSALNKLPELHAAIIRGIYSEQISIKDLGEIHNLSAKNIKKIQAEAIAQLQSIAINQKQCPQCSRCTVVKNGKRRGKQAYICKSCSYQFRDEALPVGRPSHDEKLKFEVVKAVSEGKSSLWCEVYLGVGHSSAHRWNSRYNIDNLNLSQNRMTVQIQWQLTGSFFKLAEQIIKVCPESTDRDAVLKSLNDCLAKTQKAIEAKPKQ